MEILLQTPFGKTVNTKQKILTNVSLRNYNEHVQEVIEQAFEQSLGWDVVIKAGAEKKEFKCHRLILTSSSDFLSTLLKEGLMGKEPVVLLPDVDPQIMENILIFIYTGNYF